MLLDHLQFGTFPPVIEGGYGKVYLKMLGQLFDFGSNYHPDDGHAAVAKGDRFGNGSLICLM